MIIVSQSKLLILNFNNLLGLGVKSSNDNKSIEIKAYEFGIKDIEGITLGRYKTLERAKQILQEITYKYQEYVQINSRATGVERISVLPKKYEMPKE